MFTAPRLTEGQQFPELPIDHPQWQTLLDALEVSVDPAKEDPLLTLTRHAIGWVEDDPAYVKPWHTVPIKDSSKTPILRDAGFVDGIDPFQKNQNTVVMDGGHLSAYEIRLDYADEAQACGKLETPNVVLFGGQRLRTPRIDSSLKLTAIAEDLRGKVDQPTDEWLAHELAKDECSPDRWEWPFASERELGRLALAKRYQGALKYIQTIPRLCPKQLHPSIPVSVDAADEFNLGGQRILVLNAPAIIREHAGRKQDLSVARPTGRSCFLEWLDIDKPTDASTVMLATSAPNIYRSWLDLVLGAHKNGRPDLQLTAAGPGVVETRTIGHALVGLGDLIINFYNLMYEGGKSGPGA
jgi:hypothetical protein